MEAEDLLVEPWLKWCSGLEGLPSWSFCWSVVSGIDGIGGITLQK